jgi:hypothetical protein
VNDVENLSTEMVDKQPLEQRSVDNVENLSTNSVEKRLVAWLLC